MINGEAHGPMPATTVCQLHMRHFKDGDELYLEPWRSKAFPVVKDLVVDRSAFDRIIQAGGFISVATGSAPDANLIPVPEAARRPRLRRRRSASAAAPAWPQCPNGAAQLFTSAKVSHLEPAPAGPARALRPRPLRMVEAMEKEGFGNCTNYAECEAVCPKEISIDFIARMNRDYLKAKSKGTVKTPLST